MSSSTESVAPHEMEGVFPTLQVGTWKTKADGQVNQLPEGAGGIQTRAVATQPNMGSNYRKQAGHRGSIVRQIIEVTYKNTPKARDGKDVRGRFAKVWEHLMEEGVFQLDLDRLLRWIEMERKVGQEQ